jgi:hypothetical protein
MLQGRGFVVIHITAWSGGTDVFARCGWENNVDVT